MFHSIVLCVAVLVAGIASGFAHVRQSPREGAPIRHTPSGAIRGAWMQTREGRDFEAYRGIRYAEPPVGELRFQPPKLVTKYKEEVDASQEGPACPLVAPPTYYVDEDCLRINIYTPKTNSSKPLPVLFYIHPGGFYSMTGRSDLVGPHYLMDKDIVLVAINYRLGSLGFISTGDALAPGNNGLKDQVAALRWVQRNIASFGGDPNSVTIAGTSAGSISVVLHMISPMARGLFHRGIAMSGSAIGKEPAPTHQYHLAVKQAQILSCPTDNSSVIMDCLKKKPWKDLGESYPKFFEFGFDPVGIWTPVVEPDVGQERYLPIDPAVAIREGRMCHAPLIISQTTEEFAWFGYNVLKNETLRNRMNAEWDTIAPISFMMPKEGAREKAQRLKQEYLKGKALVDNEESALALGRLYGDSIIGFPVHRMVNLISKYSPEPVYYYEFAYFGDHSYYEDPVTSKPKGAAHHDEMIYLFTQSYRFPTIQRNSTDDLMVQKLRALFYNFARYRNPTPLAPVTTPELDGVKWPEFRPWNRRYLRVAKELTVKRNLKEDRFKLWEELYPFHY